MGRGFDLLGGAKIKSLQTGKSSILGRNSSVDITISSVDVAKSVVIITSTTYSSSGGNGFAYAILVNGTTLRVLRNYGSSDVATAFTWQVIEFDDVKSIQSGVFNLSAAEATQTITTVNKAKSILFCSSSGGATAANTIAWGWIKDNSTLEFGRQYNYGTTTIGWFIVEFN